MLEFHNRPCEGLARRRPQHGVEQARRRLLYPAQGPGAVRPRATTAAGGIALGYDANGNLISRNDGATGRTYSVGWSAENKLASLTVGALTYKYGSVRHLR